MVTVHYRTNSDATAVASAARISEGSPKRPGRLYTRFGKRTLDLALVALAAPGILVIVAMLAVMVALDGGRPFYSQMRIGRAGRPYRMWKLRSMVPDAERRLAEHLSADPEAMAEWTERQKLRHDPRITSFGHFLRKSSLDELPQLWNVAKGDMSLVGPRPMMTCQKDLYPGRDYYDLRPGITGPWQVSARNESSFADRARFDTEYRNSLSFRGDIGLLLATVRVVLRGTGH